MTVFCSRWILVGSREGLQNGWNSGILGGLGAHSRTERVAESLAAVLNPTSLQVMVATLNRTRCFVARAENSITYVHLLTLPSST